MPTKLKSRTTTSPGGQRLPLDRPPTHPGEMLLEEFVKPLAITQVALAQRYDWELWQAMHSPAAKEISRLKPLPIAGQGIA